MSLLVASVLFLLSGVCALGVIIADAQHERARRRIYENRGSVR